MTTGITTKRMTLEPSVLISAAHPAEKSPIVIILHEAFGLNSHFDDVVSHVASHGFFAIAPDLFNGRVIDYTDMAGAMEALGACSDDKVVEIIRKVIQWAHGRPEGAGAPVALLGFCMGG
ncbi:MAG: dienelactone hydrolase family protein, partial [Phycisphaerae bacterium]